MGNNTLAHYICAVCCSADTSTLNMGYPFTVWSVIRVSSCFINEFRISPQTHINEKKTTGTHWVKWKLPQLTGFTSAWYRFPLPSVVSECRLTLIVSPRTVTCQLWAFLWLQNTINTYKYPTTIPPPLSFLLYNSVKYIQWRIDELKNSVHERSLTTI